MTWLTRKRGNEMNLATEKIHKAFDSLNRALRNIEKGNKREAVGDLHYAQENAEEACYLLLAELEEVSENEKEHG
jgi:hypothetical protein